MLQNKFAMNGRVLSPIDRFIVAVDQGIGTVFGKAAGDAAYYPAVALPAEPLTAEERARSARLMRVNHAGEIAAQALYRGHALAARTPATRAHMEGAAREEGEHLAWCARRIAELGGHTSYLNPLWYTGSFAIGALAGKAGDEWSLGFVAETERQVVRHLDEHLTRVPESDAQSRVVLERMRRDEAAHAGAAVRAGAMPLPWPVRKLMRALSRVMTSTAYWV